MTINGGCYCGELRYAADAQFTVNVACCCRECQYISGGGPNYVTAVEENKIHYSKGEPKQIVGKGGSPIREFCGHCGTHLISRSDKLQGMVMLKVGSLDDPSLFDGPDMAVYHCDAQAFHLLPETAVCFDKLPV